MPNGNEQGYWVWGQMENVCSEQKRDMASAINNILCIKIKNTYTVRYTLFWKEFVRKTL